MNLKFIYLALILCLFPSISMARPMITDLSERQIKITAKFTGKDILLYGARVEAGNIVVVIRGPEGKFLVRKKENIGGIWINTASVEYDNVPLFYRIASSENLSKLDADDLLNKMGIGKNTIQFKTNEKNKDVNIDEFKQALLAKLQNDKLFDFDIINLPFLEGTLFRIRVRFPAKITEGNYTAEIYSFNEGQLQGMQSIPINVKKVGLEAFVYNAAHHHPAVYGLLCIVMAIGTGLLAGRIFKKV